MTDSGKIPHQNRRDDRSLLIEAIVDRNEQLERENIELRRDRESLRVTLQASCDLNHKLQSENVKLRTYARQLRTSVLERQAA